HCTAVAPSDGHNSPGPGVQPQAWQPDSAVERPWVDDLGDDRGAAANIATPVAGVHVRERLTFGDHGDAQRRPVERAHAHLLLARLHRGERLVCRRIERVLDGLTL